MNIHPLILLEPRIRTPEIDLHVSRKIALVEHRHCAFGFLVAYYEIVG